MSLTKIILAAAVVAFSASAFAAKPRAIQFDSKFETEQGEKFAQYTVSCSNGKDMPLTEWQSPNQWCQGRSVAGKLRASPDQGRQGCLQGVLIGRQRRLTKSMTKPPLRGGFFVPARIFTEASAVRPGE